MLDLSFRRIRIPSAAFLCAALVLFVQGVLFFSVHAQAAPVRLEGQVSNGTASTAGGGVAALPVTLFQMAGTGPVTRTVQTDSSGRFIFENVTLTPGAPYFVQADYAGIHYFSDILQPTAGAGAPITLTVYETQTVPAHYQIDRAHFILEGGAQQITGLEFLQVQNQGDRAFLLPLPLPVGATVQFNDPRDEFRAVRGADGSVAFPMLPSTQNILLGVQFSPGPDRAIRIVTPVKLGQLNVLVPQQEGLQVSSPQLSPGPPFTPSQNAENPTQPAQTYLQLNGTNIPAGSSVSVTLTNNAALIRNGLVLGVGGLAALALLGLAFLRRHVGAGSREFVRRSRLQALAVLDDQYAAGEMDEEQYERARAALKAQLLNDTDSET